MTVRELIDALEQQPANARVLIRDTAEPRDNKVRDILWVGTSTELKPLSVLIGVNLCGVPKT